MSKYVINKETFKTKKALLERIRQIRDNAKIGSRLPKPEFDFMLDILRMHPHAAQKIGCGVVGIYVREHPAYYNSLGFWAVRVDGTHTNFSFLQCVKGSGSKLAQFKKMCRFAADPSTFRFKKWFFDSNANARCPYTGYIITFLGSHVHHAGENTFNKIVTDFIQEYQIDVSEIEIQDSDTGRDSFSDAELTARFVEFHDARAELQVISEAAHIELTGQSKKE